MVLGIFSGCTTTIYRCKPPPKQFIEVLKRPTIYITKGDASAEFLKKLNEKLFPYVERLEGDRRATAVWTANCK